MPGSLVVNKTITGPAAGQQGAVTIGIVCNGTELPDLTIPAGAPAGTTSRTYNGIPAGAACTLSETLDGHTDAVQVTVAGDRQATIPAAGSATASLVDTYIGTTGRLRVEKTITGPGAGSQAAVRIGVTCDGQALPDFVIPAGAPAGTRSHTYVDVPAFATCTAYELANGHTTRVVLRVVGSAARVTIPANGTATLRLTETYRAVATRQPRLALRKTASSRRVVGGHGVTFRLVVTNRGSATATNVAVCDRLPSRLVFLSTSGARLVNGSACWTIRRLAPHLSRSFTVRTQSYRTSASERVCNRAAARASRGARAAAVTCVRVLAAPGRGGGVTG